MMLRSLSMTGVAVDMFVQIQFGAVRGSTVVSIVRRHSAAPVAASSAVSVFDAESVYTTVFVPCAVRMPWATSGAVSIELPDSISIDTSLSIWVFHLSARRPIDCLDSADSPRFQPLRSISPPHVSHSPVRPLCAYADQEIPASQQARTRHVVRISVISPSVKVSVEDMSAISKCQHLSRTADLQSAAPRTICLQLFTDCASECMFCGERNATRSDPVGGPDASRRARLGAGDQCGDRPGPAARRGVDP